MSQNLIDWLADRRANCLHIAKTKHGDERNGWLEDGTYFLMAQKAVEHLEEAYGDQHANVPLRTYIALKILRAWHPGGSAGCVDARVVIAIDRWFDGGRKGPVPWPESPFFAEWAERQGLQNVGVPVEQLLTPLTRYLAQRPEQHFAVDNGAFSGFDGPGFERLLARHWERRELCRFVACPDVVGSARRTLEAFDHWRGRLEGWRLALVAQDGLESLPIPWSQIDAVFIGGSTAWKLGKDAADVIRTAKICGKWVHAGRVNTPGRFEYFDELGVDSIDGTGLSRYSWMRREIYRAVHEPGLFE